MPKPWKIIAIITPLFFIIMSACGPAAVDFEPTPQETLAPDTRYTEAVQTVAAELTQAAGRPTATELPLTPTQIPNTPTPTDPAPTPTPLPTDTPVPSPLPASPTPTAPAGSSPTPVQDDPRSRLGSPDRRENFSSRASWMEFEDDHFKMEVDDGRLEMTAFNPDFWNGWVFSPNSGEDFYVEITAEHERPCAGADRYGIIFRSPDARSGYLAGFSCDGRYSLWKWDGSRETRIISWTSSPHILTGAGERNRLGVMAQGSRISLYANGRLLEEATDDTYSQGRVGNFIGAAETRDYTAYVYDLSFWLLPQNN
jgi:hypothetical protein